MQNGQMRRVCILLLGRSLYRADLGRVRRRNEDRTRYRLPRGDNTGSANVRGNAEATSCRDVEPAVASEERSKNQFQKWKGRGVAIMTEYAQNEM